MIEGDYRHYRFRTPRNKPSRLRARRTGCGCGTVVGNAVYQTGICPSTDRSGLRDGRRLPAPHRVQRPGPSLRSGADRARERRRRAARRSRSSTRASTWAPGYLTKRYNYLGYPRISGVGFGITKLPDLDGPVSLEGSAWYYPRSRATTPTRRRRCWDRFRDRRSRFRMPSGNTARERPSTSAVRLFFDFGVTGERANARNNAPANTTVNAPYAGLGLHF